MRVSVYIYMNAGVRYVAALDKLGQGKVCLTSPKLSPYTVLSTSPMETRVPLLYLGERGGGKEEVEDADHSSRSWIYVSAQIPVLLVPEVPPEVMKERTNRVGR